MILFIILSLILIAITTITVLAVSTLGAAGIVLFGDVIVCGIIIGWILKRLITRKKN